MAALAKGLARALARICIDALIAPGFDMTRLAYFVRAVPLDVNPVYRCRCGHCGPPNWVVVAEIVNGLSFQAIKGAWCITARP
jgi:hypothetical protein